MIFFCFIIEHFIWLPQVALHRQLPHETMLINSWNDICRYNSASYGQCPAIVLSARRAIERQIQASRHRPIPTCVLHDCPLLPRGLLLPTRFVSLSLLPTPYLNDALSAADAR